MQTLEKLKVFKNFNYIFCPNIDDPLLLRNRITSGPQVKNNCSAGNFLFITASRMALGPTQLPIQWIPEALSMEVKRPGREADHSSPSSAEVKE
jgi:hypothetical protein